MKEKDAYVDFEPQQLIMYVEKEDGTFGPIRTGSYISKNYLDDFWEKTVRLRNSLLEKVKKGDITIIEFYKTIHDFNNVELARRTKLPVFKVKRHQKAKGFKNISLSDLQKYAYAFDIPVTNLFQTLVIEDNENNVDTDITQQPVQVKQTRTENPFMIITKIELNKK